MHVSNRESIRHSISILWFCNIRAVKKQISIFDMYIPCEASSWTLLHQNRKLSSRISLPNQLFCLCRLPALYKQTWKVAIINGCPYENIRNKFLSAIMLYDFQQVDSFEYWLITVVKMLTCSTRLSLFVRKVWRYLRGNQKR